MDIRLDTVEGAYVLDLFRLLPCKVSSQEPWMDTGRTIFTRAAKLAYQRRTRTRGWSVDVSGAEEEKIYPPSAQPLRQSAHPVGEHGTEEEAPSEDGKDLITM